MRDGKAIETATIGREGAVGAMAGLGCYVSRVRTVAYLPLLASRIPATQFRQVVGDSNFVADLCIRSNEVLLGQTGIIAACNSLHPVEVRFARWLLQTREHAQGDTIPLTHKLISKVLGVSRTQVTLVAARIKYTGAITYSRGVIKIVDIDALKAISCQCHDQLANLSNTAWARKR